MNRELCCTFYNYIRIYYSIHGNIFNSIYFVFDNFDFMLYELV